MAQQRSSIGGGGYKQETVYKQEPGVPVAANDHVSTTIPLRRHDSSIFNAAREGYLCPFRTGRND